MCYYTSALGMRKAVKRIIIIIYLKTLLYSVIDTYREPVKLENNKVFNLLNFSEYIYMYFNIHVYFNVYFVVICI